MPKIKSSGAFVLLTGSTGNLGSHIFAELANNHSVVRVMCLTRPRDDSSTPLEHQLAAQKRKIYLLPKKTRQISKSLPPTLRYPTSASRTVSTIPFVAHLRTLFTMPYQMDFNRELSSFEIQFIALNNLISPPSFRLHFLHCASWQVSRAIWREHIPRNFDDRESGD